MSLSQDKLARAFSPRLAIQFRQLIEQNTQLFYNQKKRHQTSLIFLVSPPPIFYDTFGVFFVFPSFLLYDFFPQKKIVPRSKGVWQPTSSNLHRSSRETNRFFQRWFHQAGQHRARRRGGPAELGSLAVSDRTAARQIGAPLGWWFFGG